MERGIGVNLAKNHTVEKAVWAEQIANGKAVRREKGWKGSRDKKKAHVARVW